MGYSYKVNKINFKTKDGIEHTKYYACAKRGKLVSSKELAQEISERSSLTAGDIYGSLSALSDVIKNHLLLGNSIKLDGIGIISLSITSEASDEEDKVNARTVKVGKICFRADRELNEDVQAVSFVKERDTPKGYMPKTK